MEMAAEIVAEAHTLALAGPEMPEAGARTARTARREKTAEEETPARAPEAYNPREQGAH
jgi:hypothetical protein